MAKEENKSQSAKKTSVVARKRTSVARKRPAKGQKLTAVARNKGSLVVVRSAGTKGPMVTQFVLPLGNGWVVKSSNSKTFAVITDTRQEAISLGRSLARTKNSELIVHNKDGRIAIKESYAKVN